jgi:hypothetical protein
MYSKCLGMPVNKLLSWNLFSFLFITAGLQVFSCSVFAGDIKRLEGPHGLFSYVTHYSEDEIVYRQPVVTSPDQMTVLHPTNELFDGVILIIYWSILNPKEGEYDFSALDDALKYWSAKGKKVGLNVATVGYPILMSKKFGGGIMTATPDWVMRQVTQYEGETPVFDHKANPKSNYKFPVYWDPKFIRATTAFISELGKHYEANPSVSFVRIGTGFVGEEQPTAVGGLKPKIPEYSAARWFSYTEQMVAAYEKSFPQKPLEYDLLWSCWIAATGESDDTAMALKFVESLANKGIVLGHNGFRSESEKLEGNSKHGHGQCLQILEHYSQAGHPVMAEMYGPPWQKEMLETDSILRVMEKVKPIRVNFFGTAVAVLNQESGSENEKTNAASWLIYTNAIKSQGLEPKVEAQKQQTFIHALVKQIR